MTQHMSTPRRILGFIFVSLLLSTTGSMATGKYFTPPESEQPSNTDEIRHHIFLSSGHVYEAQSVIDATRKAIPEARLMIEINGALTVKDTPLRLGSNMSLVLLPSARIEASPKCKAESLIEIVDAGHVSISAPGAIAGTVDGKGFPVTGIRIRGGKRILIDNLNIIGCDTAGIDYSGRDSAVFNEAAAVTRCSFIKNRRGLRIASTAAFLCLDNTFSHHKDIALEIDSLNSIVAGNSFDGNSTGIYSSSDRAILARNSIRDLVAIELSAHSEGNLITENIGDGSGQQMRINGAGHQVFRNRKIGQAILAEDCAELFLISNPGMECTKSDVPDLRFFDPPTFSNHHKNPVIVRGMGRHDIPLIQGGRRKKGDREAVPAVDLAYVQTVLNQARADYPNDVLVLKLEGEFISLRPAGLVIPPNTCIILDGRILADLGTALEPDWVRGAELSQIILLPETGYSSISGGKLDGGRQAFHPINANTGSIALIEDVNVASGARDGIYTKGRSHDPVFIYRCNVYANGGRGIWSHVAKRIHSIANNCVANNSDGIDLDAHSIDCTALFNTCTGNKRHGVFVEEAIDHNIVFGNHLNANHQAGVHVWNEEVVGNTGPNLIAANQCKGNRRGVSVGGRAMNKTAHGNFFFNNICRENRLNGIWDGNSKATGNYFSQNIVMHNRDREIATSSSAKAIYFDTAAEPTRKGGRLVTEMDDSEQSADVASVQPVATTVPSSSRYEAGLWLAEQQAKVDTMADGCDLIFIGDSITYAWDSRLWRQYYEPRRALNFGLPGDTIQNVLHRLDYGGLKTLKPKVAVILIGTNNGGPATETAQGILAVIEKTQELFTGVKIILMDILPTARRTEHITATNEIICGFVDNKSVFRLNLAERMKPEGDSWKGLEADKLHLSSEGYAIWAEMMEPLLETLLNE